MLAQHPTRKRGRPVLHIPIHPDDDRDGMRRLVDTYGLRPENYTPRADAQAAGYVAEFTLKRWLEALGANFRHYPSDWTTGTDFRIGRDQRVEMKTSTTRGELWGDWATILNDTRVIHDEPPDRMVFAVLCQRTNTLAVLGACTVDQFLDHATYVSRGKPFPHRPEKAAGHPCYVAQGCDFMQPFRAYLESVGAV